MRRKGDGLGEDDEIVLIQFKERQWQVLLAGF
jgi:hypothetical protein